MRVNHKYDNLTTDWEPFQEYGAYYRLLEGCLLVCPMLLGGAMETEDCAADVAWDCIGDDDVLQCEEVAARLVYIAEHYGPPPSVSVLQHLRDLHAVLLKEGEPGDTLHEICSVCHVRQGDKCQCPELDDYLKRCKRNYCRWCGIVLPDTILGTDYKHPGGWPVRGLSGTYWLYRRCAKCDYDWALWKLGVPMYERGPHAKTR